MIEDDQQLQDLILSIHHTTIAILGETNVYKIIENQNGKAYIRTSN